MEHDPRYYNVLYKLNKNSGKHTKDADKPIFKLVGYVCKRCGVQVLLNRGILEHEKKCATVINEKYKQKYESKINFYNNWAEKRTSNANTKNTEK